MQEIPVRLRAFVGRSFLESDKQLWHDLRDLLDTLRPIGFVCEDAKEPQARPVSEKVRELIQRNDVYIGLLTRRYAVADSIPTVLQRCIRVFSPGKPTQWTTSEWVVEEVGYAIGRDKRVILLIEEGVLFPTADLDADTEWIPFQRQSLAAAQAKLASMVNNLIGQTIPTAIVASSTDAPRAKPTEVEPAQVKSFSDQLDELRKYAASGNTAEADRIQNEILAPEPADDREPFNTFLLAERARTGDGSALTRLRTSHEADLSNIEIISWLVWVYSSFGEHAKAEELYQRSKPHIKGPEITRFVVQRSHTLKQAGKASEGLQQLRERLTAESSEPERLAIWKALADSAESLNDKDLEAGFLEKVVELEPTNHDRRFRLAWLYSALGRSTASAYHYDLIVRKAHWESARNNLGVAYGELGLKGAEVDQYQQIADKHHLSKANVALLYANAGFLGTAEPQAKHVLQEAEDETAIARARYVLDEIAATRKKEKEAIAKIEEDTRKERDFMSAYADGYCATLPPFDSVYRFPDLNIHIKVNGNVITGYGSEKQEYGGGLLLSAMFGQQFEPGVRYFRRYDASLKGRITGRAGDYELTIQTFDPPDSAKPESSRTAKGLFVIQPDLMSIAVLERDDKRLEITSVPRQG